MIFLDTSAIYALANRADPHHAAAREGFEALLAAGERILTHNYVVLESLALLQRRLGLAAAIELARSAEAFEVEWVDKTLHDEAVRRLAESGRRVSLVDHVSFAVMRLRGVSTALAFDADFVDEGFDLCTGSAQR